MASAVQLVGGGWITDGQLRSVVGADDPHRLRHTRILRGEREESLRFFLPGAMWRIEQLADREGQLRVSADAGHLRRRWMLVGHRVDIGGYQYVGVVGYAANHHDA